MVKIISAKSPNEIETISKLAKEIWLEHYVPIIGEKQVEYMLDKFQSYDAISKTLSEGEKYYIVEEDGLPRGYFGIIEKGKKVYLDKIYILKDCRGKGLGREVLGFIENYATERNIRCIYLTVNKRNAHSIDAYKKYGFVTESAIISDIGGGFVMDDYQMYKYI